MLFSSFFFLVEMNVKPSAFYNSQEEIKPAEDRNTPTTRKKYLLPLYVEHLVILLILACK
jgi:hypothetical protein